MPVLARYERICFDKAHIAGPPVAAFVCPGHPLLDATIDLVLERHRELLKQGTILVDPRDPSEQLRVLVTLDQSIQDGRTDRHGRHQVVARRLHFVELLENGGARDAGPAPYLDYRPASEAEGAAIAPKLDEAWLAGDLQRLAETHAIQHLIPSMMEEVRARRLTHIDKVEREVQARLKREIVHWDHRAEVLKDQERAGKQPRMNPQRAAQRAEELSERLRRRLNELARERDISALPPVVVGGALVVPEGLLRILGVRDEAPDEAAEPEVDPARRTEIEQLAMDAVIATERALGFEPRDVSRENHGYDIESRDAEGHLRFIEVKGLGPGNDRVTITRNELLRAKNASAQHRLAIVRIDGEAAAEPGYISAHDFGEVSFAETSRTFSLSRLLSLAREPH